MDKRLSARCASQFAGMIFQTRSSFRINTTRFGKCQRWAFL
ncbi:MAG: DUF6783 domain-containing protein [Ruminococcus sp.]